MRAATNALGRYRTCVRFELLKLLPRRLPWITLAVIVGATMFTGWLQGSAEPRPEKWWLYAEIVGTTLPLLTFFLVIMGCLAVNEELSSGAMRAVLVRPVGRTELLLAKMTGLVTFALLGVGVTYATAWIWVSSHGGFGAVIGDFEVFTKEIFSAEEIARHGRDMSLAAIPGVLCAPIFGIIISLLVEAAGAAVALGVFLFFCMTTITAQKNAQGLLLGLREWVFTTFVDRPFALLGDLGEGIEEELSRVEEMGVLSSDMLVPTAMLLVMSVVAVLIFRWKEIRC